MPVLSISRRLMSWVVVGGGSSASVSLSVSVSSRLLVSVWPVGSVLCACPRHVYVSWYLVCGAPHFVFWVINCVMLVCSGTLCFCMHEPGSALVCAQLWRQRTAPRPAAATGVHPDVALPGPVRSPQCSAARSRRRATRRSPLRPWPNSPTATRE